MNEERKPRCKKCGSGQVYLRISKRQLVCRMCGHVEARGQVKAK